MTWRRDEQGRVSGKAYLTVVDDYEPVQKAITAMAEKTATGELDVFTAKSFRRATIMRALFAELGSKPKRWCCADEGSRIALDVERLEVAESDTGVIRVFQQHCGACHRTQSASPPNFLYGTQREVMANLSRCAQRIYFRLNMWRLPGEARPKSPIPPALVVRSRGHTPDQWRDSEALLLLTEQAAAWVRSTTAGPGDAHALLERDYATLGKCL